MRELSAEELEKKLAELKEELFNLRFQLATGQLENNARESSTERYCTREDGNDREFAKLSELSLRDKEWRSTWQKL